MRLSRMHSEPTPETTSCRSVSTTDQPGQLPAVTPSPRAVASAPRSLVLSSRSGHWRTHQHGPTTARSWKKTTAGRPGSLLPEDAIICFHYYDTPSEPMDGSQRSSQQQKLLPSPPLRLQKLD